MRTAAWLGLLGLVALGCAREPAAPPPLSPLMPPPPGYAWPPRVVSAEPGSANAALLAYPALSPGAPIDGSAPAAADAPAPLAAPAVLSSVTIPSGDACIARLGELGIAHRRLAQRRGVDTPILVEGPLGGVEYVAGGGLPFESDCRLAIALHDVGPVIAELGIERLRYSGVYTYRMSRTGRLSLHAHGLAIDVHFAFKDGKWLSVKDDYQAGLTDGCAATSPPLNQLACQLGRTRLFKELLTPDHNADHRDHLHLAIAPIPPPAEGKTATAERSGGSASRAAEP
jgi:hypothetical protein